MATKKSATPVVVQQQQQQQGWQGWVWPILALLAILLFAWAIFTPGRTAAPAPIIVVGDCGSETTAQLAHTTLLETLPTAEYGKEGAYGLLDGYTSVGNVYPANKTITGPAIFKPDSFSLKEETKDCGIYVPIGDSALISEGSVVWRFWGENDDIIIAGESPWWDKLFRHNR